MASIISSTLTILLSLSFLFLISTPPMSLRRETAEGMVRASCAITHSRDPCHPRQSKLIRPSRNWFGRYAKRLSILSTSSKSKSLTSNIRTRSPCLTSARKKSQTAAGDKHVPIVSMLHANIRSQAITLLGSFFANSPGFSIIQPKSA